MGWGSVGPSGVGLLTGTKTSAYEMGWHLSVLRIYGGIQGCEGCGCFNPSGVASHFSWQPGVRCATPGYPCACPSKNYGTRIPLSGNLG